MKRLLLPLLGLGLLAVPWQDQWLYRNVPMPESGRPLLADQLAERLTLPAAQTLRQVRLRGSERLAQIQVQTRDGQYLWRYANPFDGQWVDELRPSPWGSPDLRWHLLREYLNGAPGWSLALLLILLQGGLLWSCLRRARTPQTAVVTGGDLVLWASQSGTAERLARLTARQLGDQASPAPCLPLEACPPERLNQAARLFLVLATTGDGEAPDHARRAERALRDFGGPLAPLEFAVLALGDRQYEHFCAFGLRMAERLEHLGARPLCAPVCMDGDDPTAWRHWQQGLRALGALGEVTDAARPWQAAVLDTRTHLNPGSPGEPVWHLRLRPLEPMHWQAGDIVEILPGNSDARLYAAVGRVDEALRHRDLSAADRDLPGRDYSLASVPADGHLELVVRQQGAGEQLGLGSGWLCLHAPLGAALPLRLRSNRGFHGQPGPMILIGAGTGMAGLRAHLRERALQGQHDNWLLFGERSRRHDALFQAELDLWLAQGHLQRLDLVFSRDGDGYVQDRLRRERDRLCDWLDRGASLYVCGSADGLGLGVQTMLEGLLGSTELERLVTTGRYRRDLY